MAQAIGRDLLQALQPLLEELKTIDPLQPASGGIYDDAPYRRYHELVWEIYRPLEPILHALLDAKILSATFCGENQEECMAWYEVDCVRCGGTIDFGGREQGLLVTTNPPPSFSVE